MDSRAGAAVDDSIMDACPPRGGGRSGSIGEIWLDDSFVQVLWVVDVYDEWLSGWITLSERHVQICRGYGALRSDEQSGNEGWFTWGRSVGLLPSTGTAGVSHDKPRAPRAPRHINLPLWPVQINYSQHHNNNSRGLVIVRYTPHILIGLYK